jgi:heme exporter protein D
MSSLRIFFWAMAAGVIVAYLFFLALGAYAVDDVLPVTIIVAVLAILWGVHAVLEHRQIREQGRDRRLVSARERRGF